MPSTPNWVRDEPRVREMDGKLLNIVGKGVFTMHISETDVDGNRNQGYVELLIEPYDLNAAVCMVKGEPL